jgi:hypothetical protein
MNEPISPLTTAEPVVPAYKDRSTGLIIFGILTLLLGGLCGLFVPLMLLGQIGAARANQAPPNTSGMLMGMVIYGAMAVALIWLGIGSIQARRWARALLLILSWSWLVMGIFALGIMTIVMPKLLANLPSAANAGQPAMPAAGLAAVLVFMFVFLGIFFIVTPAVWIFFYSSRHVKATCEARDAAARWTDACPLPVLALCLWLLFSVPMILLVPLLYHAVIPCFGFFLSGAPGAVLYVAMAAIWGYAAWLIYRLKPQGWWLILVAVVLFMVSNCLTFARHDVLEMYQLMGYPDAQIEQIRKTGLLLSGSRMSWFTALSAVPFLGYILFLKKYFRREA